MLLLYVLWTFRLLLPFCTLKIYYCITYLLVQDQMYPWFLLSLSDPASLTAYQSTVSHHVVSFYALYLEVISFFPNLIYEQKLVLPAVSYDPLMALHCMALLLLLLLVFHCLSHFHLYIVHTFSGVFTLVRLLVPENGGIMLVLMFITVYQLPWHNMHIHVLCRKYKFSSSSLSSFHFLSPFTKQFFHCLRLCIMMYLSSSWGEEGWWYCFGYGHTVCSGKECEQDITTDIVKSLSEDKC